MDQVMIKTEVQSNGEILLYYIDENGHSQEGVLTTIENTENDSEQPQDEDTSYMLESYEDLVDDPPPLECQIEEELPYPWSDEDTKRLLLFFNDNKIAFVSGSTQKRHLWAVACKTMLIGKNHQLCEEKLAELKAKYLEVRDYMKKGVQIKWSFLDLCHQAFHDDPSITEPYNKQVKVKPKPVQEAKVVVVKQEIVCEPDGVLSIKQMNAKPPDQQVEKMLNSYLKYKHIFQREHWRRDLWQTIAKEVGEKDSEYLQKRFLNYKQHYITMLTKKKENSSSNVKWAYMELFDKIYCDDAVFHKKYFNVELESPVSPECHAIPKLEWSETQNTILAKYYFDCYDEFIDNTIPNKFLWTEVGRLIDKDPEICQIRYEILYKEHLEKYIASDYNIQKRQPIAIIFDNIIARDVKIKFSNMVTVIDINYGLWKDSQVDELVQFFYDNTNVFKDRQCHFVCWAAIAHNLKKSAESCKQKWDELVVAYNTILDCKKEDSEVQIDWRYIELFDHIFDYGIDVDLLKGYSTSMPQIPNTVEKFAVKKVVIKEDKDLKQNEGAKCNNTKADEDIQNVIKPRTDPRSAEILEHYLKHKDQFDHARNKLALWDPLAKQIGMNSTQCAHRFRSLKQTYTDYVQQEIDNPRIPITWPYYGLCKKVFGYRLLKNKMKQGQKDTNKDDWLAREIKLLVSFFSKNFSEISDDVEKVSIWTPLAKELGRTETNCKEKFVELRKCYRKLKTMRSRNPDVKISWSYFNMFERIYNLCGNDPLHVEPVDEKHLEMEGVEEVEGEDDYQCIIVMQDGQDINEIQNLQQISEAIDSSELIPQITDMPHVEENLSSATNEITDIPHVEENARSATNALKWTKHTKKRLIILYLNYIRSHRNKEINSKNMWTEIASKLPNKSPVKCRKMIAKMINSYKQADDTVKKNSPLTYLLEKVLKLNNFVKAVQSKQRTYKDVSMSSDKVNLALEYYLEHVEEFVNPRFQKRYLWSQLANHISEPVSKIYNKINYLKQAHSESTKEITGIGTDSNKLLKELIAKEGAVKAILNVHPNTEFHDDGNVWSDDETKRLLIWYLSNLAKFTNPKFNRSYLWLEASKILGKSPLVCSKKMTEIRTQYRSMVIENPKGLHGWIFYELCHKIYGAGK